MDINTVKQAQTAGEARDYAIEWQHWINDQELSYGEIADWHSVFEKLAKKFDLVEEFVENAIISDSESLTDAQIERQDFVDGQIFEMIENVLGSNIDWDINPIAEIRDIIFRYYVLNSDIDEMEFYPYIKMDEEDSLDTDWCDFCDMSTTSDEMGNCIMCGNETQKG